MVLPPVITFSSKSKKQISIQRSLRQESLQGSYTTLSVLNKTRKSVREDSMLERPKVPYTTVFSDTLRDEQKGGMENWVRSSISKGTFLSCLS